MFKDISIDHPDFYFDVGAMKHHTEVYDILRQNGIQKMYAYAIIYRKNFLEYQFLKFGQSCPEPGEKTEKAIGERLGRQISWGDGWGYRKPKSSHGCDFYNNIKEEIANERLPDYLADRKYWSVGVWNIDKRLSLVENFVREDKDITEWVEGELANQYKRKYLCLPVLNYKDPTRNFSYMNCNVNKNHFNSFFSEKPKKLKVA